LLGAIEVREFTEIVGTNLDELSCFVAAEIAGRSLLDNVVLDELTIL